MEQRLRVIESSASGAQAEERERRHGVDSQLGAVERSYGTLQQRLGELASAHQ